MTTDSNRTKQNVSSTEPRDWQCALPSEECQHHDQTESNSERHSTWRDELRDLGYFPALLVAAVGTPSIISIIDSVFVTHKFITPIQEFINGYRFCVRLPATVLEPPLKSLLSWLRGILHLNLNLYPHWRYLFILALLLPAAMLRAKGPLSPNKYKHRVRFFVAYVCFALFSVAGAVVAGSLDPRGSWWMQALTCAVPVFLMAEGLVLAPTVVSHRKLRRVLFDQWFPMGCAVPLLLICAVVFGVWRLFFSQFSYAGVGLLAMGVWVALAAIAARFVGTLTLNRFHMSWSLSVIGAFLGAGLLYTIDWMAKAFGL